EGFVHLRLQPWMRRFVARAVAIFPALVAGTPTGNESLLGPPPLDERLLPLIVLSQVGLRFLLPFSIVPLVQFTNDRQRMGVFANRGWVKVLASVCALTVIGLNGLLIYLQIGNWGEELSARGISPWWVYGTGGPLAIGLAGFLGWLMI